MISVLHVLLVRSLLGVRWLEPRRTSPRRCFGTRATTARWTCGPWVSSSMSVSVERSPLMRMKTFTIKSRMLLSCTHPTPGKQSPQRVGFWVNGILHELWNTTINECGMKVKLKGIVHPKVKKTFIYAHVFTNLYDLLFSLRKTKKYILKKESH